MPGRVYSREFKLTVVRQIVSARSVREQRRRSAGSTT
jgi:hypothetical protein